MSLYELMKADRIQAMKDKAEIKKNFLSTVLGHLKTTIEIDKKREVTDEDIKEYLKTMQYNALKCLSADPQRVAEREELSIIHSYFDGLWTVETMVKFVDSEIEKHGLDYFKDKKSKGMYMKSMKERSDSQLLNLKYIGELITQKTE